MDLTTIGFAMGSAWLSGINLYATVATLGLLQHFHLVQLPGSLNYLGHPWVLIAATTLYVVEFIADKVPAVDSIWDVAHTFIRVPAGAILAASAFAHFDPAVRTVALLAGGTLALSSHGTKAATRLAANTSPEPFSNSLLSLIEDAFTIGASVVLTKYPLVVAAVVIAGLIVSIVIFGLIRRALKRLFHRKGTPEMAV